MSKKESFPFNGRDRAEYRAFRSSMLLIEGQPPVPGAANPFIPPLPTGGLPYLAYANFNKALDWVIPEFTDQDDPRNLIVEMRMRVDGSLDHSDHRYEEETPLPPPRPYPMTLHHQDKDKDGERTVDYMRDFGGNPSISLPYKYIVDKVAPTLDPTIDVPQSVKDYGIGPENFAGGNTVPLTYSKYPNQKAGHLIKCFIGPSRTVRREVGSIRVDESNKDTDLVFRLAATHVDGYDGDSYFVWVEGENYAGVPATPSALTDVPVYKDPRPDEVDGPFIPQIVDPDEDTLLIENLGDGVGAGLETAYKNYNSATDYLVRYIDGVEQAEVPLSRAGSFPFTPDLDNVALAAGGHERRQVKIAHHIRRGKMRFPKDPIERLVWQDLEKPCNPMDVSNIGFNDPSMLEPWFQGPKSTEKNRLTAADKQDGGDVIGYLPFHPRFKEGDSLEFLLNGRSSPTQWVYPTDGSVDPSKPISWPLPWSWLNSLADDTTTQVQALAYHDRNFNESHSPVATAYVRTTPTILVAAEFQHLHINPRNGWVCSSLRRHPDPDIGVVGVIRIKGDSRMEDREGVLTFGGYPTSETAEPELIPGSRVKVPFKANKEQATNGFNVYIPYIHLLAVHIGWIRADYNVDIEGEDVLTKSEVIRANMSLGGDTCKLEDVVDPPTVIGK